MLKPNLLLAVTPTGSKPARFKLKIIMPVVIGKITTAKNINISINWYAFVSMRIFDSYPSLSCHMQLYCGTREYLFEVWNKWVAVSTLRRGSGLTLHFDKLSVSSLSREAGLSAAVWVKDVLDIEIGMKHPCFNPQSPLFFITPPRVMGVSPAILPERG